MTCGTKLEDNTMMMMFINRHYKYVTQGQMFYKMCLSQNKSEVLMRFNLSFPSHINREGTSPYYNEYTNRS